MVGADGAHRTVLGPDVAGVGGQAELAGAEDLEAVVGGERGPRVVVREGHEKGSDLRLHEPLERPGR